MRLIQISSGRGPAECELAVGKYLEIFLAEHPKAIIKESHAGSVFSQKYTGQCFKSAILELPDDEFVEIGTVKWICESPFRPKHKRKNWFIDISEAKQNTADTDTEFDMYDKTVVKFQTFHCGGKGGQNVNKVETGVRLIHLPTGIAVTSTSARTQHLNRKLAMERLTKILDEQAAMQVTDQKENLWAKHEQIIRGGAFAVFKGWNFGK